MRQRLLQRALGQHGIPALVKIGAYCTSAPAAPNPASLGVWVTAPSAGPRDRARPAPYHGAIAQSINIAVRPSQLATFVDPVVSGDQPGGDTVGDRVVHR